MPQPPEPDPIAVVGFWQICTGQLPELNEVETPEAWAFGDSVETADELAALVLSGRKRATAGLMREYLEEGEPLPQPGDLSIVVKGDGSPACLIRTTEVRVGPLESVDDQFAWDEGEGDRTRAFWLREHRDFFARVTETGPPMPANPEVVFERFEVVYPVSPVAD